MSADLIFTGDLCLTAQTPAMDDAITRRFTEAALVCCNFEAPISQGNASPLPKAGPSLSQPASAVETVRNWGFNCFSLANNHMMDFGEAGLSATIDALGQDLVIGAGMDAATAFRPKTLVVRDKKIALIALAEAQFGVINQSEGAGYAWFGHPLAREAIRESRQHHDFVIVQVHAGLEMLDVPLPEWRMAYRELVSLGADLIIGHHPHVLQGMERFNDRDIYYSLGNFWLSTMLPGEGAMLAVSVGEEALSCEFRVVHSTANEITLDDERASTARLAQLSARLGEGYEDRVTAACISFWEEAYAGYFERATFGLGASPRLSSFPRMLRRLISYFRNPAQVTRENQLLLIHNLRIESHRWAIDRALTALAAGGDARAKHPKG